MLARRLLLGSESGETELDILFLAVGIVCAGTFLYTFLTLEAHSKQPARVLARIDRDR